MTRLLALGAVCALSAGNLLADEPRLINFTVTIASGPAAKFRPEPGVAATGSALLSRIEELDKSGELAALTRLHFTAIENQEAKFQFGESVPTVSSRTSSRDRGAQGGFPGGATPFGGQAVSFSRTQVGTLIGAVARVVDGGVLAQLEIEQTKQDPQPAGDDPIPPKSATLSFKSGVRIPMGETVMLASLHERSGKETRHTVVLVSASQPDGAPKGARVDGELKIFSLQNANAEQLRKVLMTLYPDAMLTLACDERSNSLIVRGTQDQLEIIEALAQHLDRDEKR